MLTLILLVVLGGGVGLMAVSLAESSKPATDDGSSPRGPADDRHLSEPDESPVPRGGRAAVAVAPPPTDPAQATTPPATTPPATTSPVGPPPAPRPAHVSAPPVARTPAPHTATPTIPVDAGPPRVASRGDVPRAYTAVEGRYQDVARAPWWRRVVSLVLMVTITVVVGAVIAAVLAATIGAVSEVVGNTIG